jgi:hypothetical protein
MLVSKKILLYASCLLVSNNCLLAAHEFYIAAAVRRSLPRLASLQASSFNYNTVRWYSHSNDKSGLGSISKQTRDSEWQQLTSSLMNLESRLEGLIKRGALIAQKQTLEAVLDNIRLPGCVSTNENLQNNVLLLNVRNRDVSLIPDDRQNSQLHQRKTKLSNRLSASSKPKRAQAEIRPVDSKASLVATAPLRHQVSSFKPMQEFDLESSDNSGLKQPIENVDTKTHSLVSRTQGDALSYYPDLSKSVNEMRSDLVNRVMRAGIHNIDQENVKDILDLYTALPNRSIEGISSVLNGQIDTHKSATYSNVKRYVVLSKGSDLDTYREIYMRLCSAFGKEAVEVISRVVKEMVSENKDMLARLNIGSIESNLSLKDYICILVKGANPLYPVQPYEVEAILAVYATLPNRPKEGISKVLKGQIDTNKSGIYSNVLRYVVSLQESDLDTYRNIYARLSKSLDEQAMKIIYHMINNGIPLDINHKHTSLPKQALTTDDLDLKPSNKLQSQNHLMLRDFCVETGLIDTTRDRASKHLYTSSYSDRFLKTVGGKYHLSPKEKARLNRLYELLPEYHARSITWVLSGRTQSQKLPIWSDIHNAINQMKEEAGQEEDSRLINLKDLRKLYWATIRASNGSKSSLNVVSGDDERGGDTTTLRMREQARLNRLYELLPEYQARSITWVLSGRTQGQKLPIWLDIEESIDRIKQEAAQEGEDSELINLNYFQNLYARFVKVAETSSSKTKVESDNKKIILKQKTKQRKKQKTK